MGKPRSNNLNSHLTWLFSNKSNYTPAVNANASIDPVPPPSPPSLPASSKSGCVPEKTASQATLEPDSDFDFLAELSGESVIAPESLEALPLPPTELPRSPELVESNSLNLEVLETPKDTKQPINRQNLNTIDHNADELAQQLNELSSTDHIDRIHEIEEDEDEEEENAPIQQVNSMNILDQYRYEEPEMPPSELFRLSSSQDPVDPPQIEIGSLLAEKVAILEKKIGILNNELKKSRLQVDTFDVDQRLKLIDARISNFDGSEHETPISLPQSSPIIDTIAYNDCIFDSDDIQITNIKESDITSNFANSANNSKYFSSQQPLNVFSSTQQTPLPNSMQQEPFYKDVMQTLHKKFGLNSFRPNQAEAVTETLKGNDVVVLMPTGGGKSLCYQLPALVKSGSTQGTTVVISPLISLMEDQVYHLKNRNIQAEMINSKLELSERRQAFALLESDSLELVYLSPEMLSASTAMKSVLKQMYLRNALARIVIDEAHCVSAWGHDFRPEYMELTKVKNLFPNTPIMALTATANNQVLLDIVNCVRPNPLVLKQSFNRVNLNYEVRRKTNKSIEEIAEMAKMYRNKSGIVYCWSKKDCESTAKKLEDMGVRADFYHAGMDAERRSLVQKQWQLNQTQVVCATIAFGMGIDKPDVRFVVHLSLPRTMEGYYQETGRAGRDGKQSQAILYYKFSDYLTINRMIREDDVGADVMEHHAALLKKVMQYCENDTDCRRKQVLQYFNENFDPKLCDMKCDNCCTLRDHTVSNKDVSAPAQCVVKALNAVKLDRVTDQQCIEILCGKSSKRIRESGYERLQEYGSLSSYGPTFVERLVHDLLSRNVLEDYTRHNMRFSQSYIRLGPNAQSVLNGTMRVSMRILSNGEKRHPPARGSIAKRPRVY